MTTTDLPVIHQYQVSPFSAKIRRCLHYKNIDFRVVNYGLSGVNRVKKLNPRSKAPVLEHGGRMIPDSTDIIHYLDSIYPQNPVVPGDPDHSAIAHILEDWADESLYFYDLTMRSWPNNANLLAEDLVMEDRGLLKKLFRLLAPKIIARQAYGQGIGRKDKQAVCREIGVHFRAINILASQGEWLVGNDLSIADIAVASMCTVLERAEEAKVLMEALQDLTAWRDRVDRATLPDNTPVEQRALV